jgi:WD40 repeat protein
MKTFPSGCIISIQDFLLENDPHRDPNLNIHSEKTHGMPVEKCIELISGVLKQNMFDLDDASAAVTELDNSQIRRFLPQTFEGYGPALALAFSSEGRILPSDSSNGKIELWDIDTVQLLECDGELIQTVVFHREERTLLSVSRRGTLRLWDTVICYYILRIVGRVLIFR